MKSKLIIKIQLIWNIIRGNYTIINKNKVVNHVIQIKDIQPIIFQSEITLQSKEFYNSNKNAIAKKALEKIFEESDLRNYIFHETIHNDYTQLTKIRSVLTVIPHIESR